MSDYITTYSGVHMVPVAPAAEDIHLVDIAHALSLLCRGNGHVKTFFSVGQHCIFCAREAEARGYSARISLACLLHDASEAYLSDITRPFKQHLKEYRVFEERLLAVIYEKYLGSGLSDEEAAIVKQIDDDMMYYDLIELLNEVPAGEAPALESSISYQFRPFEEVEAEYKECFERYNV